MSWFWKKTPPEDQLANELYEGLVSNGGPGSDSFDALSLDINASDLDRFSSKNTMRLETFMFGAICEALAENKPKQQKLMVAFSKVLKKKWEERGITLSDNFDVGEVCFNEMEKFLGEPVPTKWGSEWLNEFYGSKEEVMDHLLEFVDHCLKEYHVMKQLVERYS